jgi:hypothetical protein
MSNEKKKQQLGMNPSTASGRLVKDILFSLIQETGKNSCHVCWAEMTRDTFSIEHKDPWLDSDNPREAFFDLDNISFSHLACNSGRARRPPLLPCGTDGAYVRGCRCSLCTKTNTDRKRRAYTPAKRRKKYLETGQ